ncbi:uncharacterized protein N7529_004250 [Penicillium soppii]|jgi:hypothetical protein|uniref:uncharacterized protein n=1 Tax=Penicillium soppii TaxID=69789 RepID=UPI002548F112|nr:uncharacterized protein N7529_004250 [Penicillium soppii]KAJ5871897.1 hypothetical protein N7529_004250 [Penicillium soppii]
MPSPATPRSSNRGATAKSTPKLDIGEPLGAHDTNTVRSIVRKWQQQGGGVVTIDDPYADDDDENNAKPNPKPIKAKAEKLETKETKPPQVRKRSHSTPRKRVVSDEHWKRTRNRASTQSASRNLPAPKRISVYTINERQTRSSRGRGDDSEDESEKGRDLPRSHAKRGAGPRSPVRESRSARRYNDTITESDYETDNGRTVEPSVISERLRTKSPPPEDAWASSEADFSELSRRRARGAPKPPKGGIFAHMIDESKKIFAKPEPEQTRPTPTPTTGRGAKIEAWLSDTPDPFMDESKSDMPAPLDLKSGRARRSQKLADGEPQTQSEPSIISERPKSSDSRPKSAVSRHSRGKSSISSADKPKAHDRETVEPKRAVTDRIPKVSVKSKEEPLIPQRPYEDSLAPSESELQPFSDTGSEVSNNNAPVPLGLKRPFPATGYHRLSTIASAETLSTTLSDTTEPMQKSAHTDKHKSALVEEAEEAEEAEKEDQFDPDSLPVVSSQLKRRLTTHNDLMSVLSVSASRSRSIRSNRSIRTNKSRLAHATVEDLLYELSSDESKYMRELKTLVGGVIPVLLTCVLSRSDSAIAAGLFRPSLDPQDDVNFSKPIVNMGVAIERLKNLHKRIPQDNADALLTWAQGAQRVYREYLKAWRLGFKDVIVNLAPLEEDDQINADTKSLDEGLERDENGDIVDADGGKVDVAYLLKRPLVRLKYLAKSFKGINMLQPSAKAEETAAAYQNLVIDARKRVRDERARLEDDSAASIDPTRTRDPMTLGVLHGIAIDQTRRVRARDFFNLSLYHSSGQLVDCRAELLYRDNTSSKGPGGDLLICEIDHADRWLLFPPMDLRCVSARRGESKNEIVMMLRSAPDDPTKYWQELISLRIDEEEVGTEWISLLGSDPIPPSICRSQSFISRAKQNRARKPTTDGSPPRPNPSDVDVPIGEKVRRRRSSAAKELFSEPSTVSSATDPRSSLYSINTRETEYTTGGSELSGKAVRPDLPLLPSTDARNSPSSPEKTPTGLKRSKAKRFSRYGDTPSEPASPQTAASEKSPEKAPEEIATAFPQPSTPTGGRYYGGEKDESSSKASPREKSRSRIPQPQKTPVREPEPESPRVSSVPSATLPLIPKIRTPSSQTHLSTPTELGPDEEEDYPPLESLPKQEEVPETPTRTRRKKSRRRPKDDDSPPPPPPHRSPSPANNKRSSAPILTSSLGGLKRRGSSPLKHEYEPSTASDYSETDSDASTVRHYSYSSSEYSRSASFSDSEDDYSSVSEDDDDYNETPKPRIPDVATEASSLSPSNSASQSGYRAVPLQPTKTTKAIASVFAWSDKGSWETLVPDECSIVVSPGLIEAFALGTEPNANSDSKSSRPLISLELTPLVPIRRGTAIDISIRSPPTERSKITSSNNIMFRSRNPDECDSLYGLINQSRINNPTYIALQNARGPYNDNAPTFEPATKPGGIFGWPRRRKSYRASSSPRSLAEGSESSVGTMSSAFSALKRFGTANKMFNISRSTIESRREGSIYSSDSNNPNTGIGRIAAAIKGADGIGLSNAKIRLYARESASKWRDLGAARMTIMPAPPKNPSRPSTSRSDSSIQPDDPSPPASGAASPRRAMEAEKRIVIRGKTRGETLLDVCLGENAFERIARTGIAVSIREEDDDAAVAQKGGVATGSGKIFMIQMKSEAEAAYTFGLVGKLRY